MQEDFIKLKELLTEDEFTNLYTSMGISFDDLEEDEFYNKIDEKQSISSLDKPVSDDLFSELVHDTSSSSLLNEPVKNLKKERNTR